MTQDSSVNPYATPAADIEVSNQSGEIVFCDPKKLTGGDGNRFISEAWGLYKKAPIKWTLMSLLTFILVMVVSLVPVVGSLIGSILFIPVFAGLYMGAEAITQGESLKFSHLFSGFKARGLKLIGFALVYSIFYILALVIPFIAMGAMDILPMMFGQQPDPETLGRMGGTFFMLMLVVMAFMIPLMMAYWFAVPLITFQNDGVFEALGKSFKASLKNIWPMFIYGLMIMVWSLIAVIPVGLGLLILMPIMVISIYTSYRKIFTE